MRQSNYRLIDTDVASYVFSGKSERQEYIPYLQGYTGAISFVTVAELLRGAYQKQWGRRRIQEMESFIQGNYVVLPYNADVARQWALLVANCVRGGFNPGDNDAWIAASAVAFSCTLVARDNHFREIQKHHPELSVLP
jgi:predicted nucleic acid-binding protein